eukprot:TRINITY_DN30117_c0_g1_i1.p1 TRINITY_DN30117_c0_g1~~TRINITY_DN30117_c0_g1_i1.p1  ORF type:complete len:366 (+),score=44.00 TRINITY_DN30117_c0_g1_i1:73-1170(+)
MAPLLRLLLEPPDAAASWPLDLAHAESPFAPGHVANDVEPTFLRFIAARPRHFRGKVLTSFYIDCSRHWLKPLGMLRCMVAKFCFGGFRGWKKAPRVLYDIIPRDCNCKSINYVLKRSERQWYRCCEGRGLPGFMAAIIGLTWKCQKVSPSAWYNQRLPAGEPQTMESSDAVMCWKYPPTDFWNCQGQNYTRCSHMAEQCVVMGSLGSPASKVTPFSFFTNPRSMSVYIFSAPSPLQLVAMDAPLRSDQCARSSCCLGPKRESCRRARLPALKSASANGAVVGLDLRSARYRRRGRLPRSAATAPSHTRCEGNVASGARGSQHVAPANLASTWRLATELSHDRTLAPSNARASRNVPLARLAAFF